MAELLIELLSEEIPARMQRRAAEDFRRLVVDRLKAEGLTHGEARAFSGPRRLALVVPDLPERQPDRTEERKGPRVGAPDQAIQGFLNAAGLGSLDECEQREVGKAVFWFAVRRVPGRPAREVLSDLVADAVRAIPWPKSMRWADTEGRYVRPLKSIVAVLDGESLPGGVDFGGTQGFRRFGAETVGHRFLAPEPLAVTGLEAYRSALEGAHVLLDADERKARIRADLDRLAAAEGLSAAADEALLDEVSGLVEWPVVMLGSIDERFMDVPPEVLITSMRSHQKVSALHRADGRLAPRFAFVANTVASDGGRQIVAGNERVLRARLSDAEFFWTQDRKVPLAQRLPALDKVVFHARLGSLGERVARLESLAELLAPHVPGADVAEAVLAARLAKADLVSGMVGEFPELQGLMGSYYARHEGLAGAIADAIAEHYGPAGPHDRCPTASVSVVVALAEKIDTLVGFFAIDEKPTGSRDPYALRRAALGVVRLVLENGLRIRLVQAFTQAHALYGRRLGEARDAAATARDLLTFVGDRLKVHLRESGVRHDHIGAVFALEDEDDLVRLMARVAALARFLESEDGGNLLIAYRRARNIVQIEEKRDQRMYREPVDSAALVEPEERALAAALAAAELDVRAAVGSEDFVVAMAQLARLREPVDAFFERVTVNVDNAALRANRLRSLAQIVRVMEGVADFGLIEG